MMGFGIDSAIAKHDGLASEIFATTAATPRILDQSIRGTWDRLLLLQQPRLQHGQRPQVLPQRRRHLPPHVRNRRRNRRRQRRHGRILAATGIWAAKDGVLTIITADGTTLTFKYRLVDGSLVTYDAGNNGTIWSR